MAEVKRLLAEGADAAYAGRSGHTALHIVARSGRPLTDPAAFLPLPPAPTRRAAWRSPSS